MVIATYKRGGGSSASLTESFVAFNRYANYILYGENSDSSIEGSYRRWDAYEFNRQLSQNNDNYWNTSLSMLDKSVALYPKDAESAALSNLQNYQRNFQFFTVYRRLEEPTVDSVFKTYYNSGRDAAKEDVKSFYADRFSSASTSAQSYMDAKIAQYQALIEYLVLYHDAGCLNAEGVDLLCPNIDTQQALALQDEMNNEAYEAELVIQDLERTIVSDCWQISNQLQALIEDKEGYEQAL